MAWLALAPWCLEALCGSAGRKVGGCSPQPFPLSSCLTPLCAALVPNSHIYRSEMGEEGVSCVSGGFLLCCWTACGQLLQRLNPLAPIWILSEQVWAPPAGKQLQGKRKAQSCPGPLGAPQPWGENKGSPGRCEPLLLYAILPSPGMAPAAADRTPKLPVFSGFSCCHKYRPALADCSTSPI